MGNPAEMQALTGVAKHGISFTAAARALEDPRKIEIIDDRFDYKEDRIQSLCMDQGKVLFVVTVMPDENVCRITTSLPNSKN